VLLDLFTVKFLVAYGTRPAHLFGFWGLGVSGLGAATLAYLAWVKFVQGEAIGGRPLMIVGAMLLGLGLLLILNGLLAELLVRIYHESQGKPIYVVKELAPATEREPERAVPGR
jgi:hypothetical protein